MLYFMCVITSLYLFREQRSLPSFVDSKANSIATEVIQGPTSTVVTLRSASSEFIEVDDLKWGGGRERGDDGISGISERRPVLATPQLSGDSQNLTDLTSSTVST